MSEHTHSMCFTCWEKRFPMRVPHRLIGEAAPNVQQCCYCSKDHVSGIYLKAHPSEVPCGGTRGLAHAWRMN